MLVENSLWPWFPHLGNGDDDDSNPKGLGGLEEGSPAPQQQLKTEALRTGRYPKSCIWEIAEIGFELRSPESERAGRTIGPRRGRCCPDLPVPLNPTSPFCPVTQYTGSLAGASLAHSVCSRVDTGSWRQPPPPQASPFLSCARRGVPCVKRAGCSGGWVDVRMWASQAGSLPAVTSSRPGLGPHPFLLLLFPRSSCNLEQEAGGPRMGRHLVSQEQAWALTIMERFLNNNDSYNNGFCLLGGFFVASTISFKHIYISTYFVPCAILHPYI